MSVLKIQKGIKNCQNQLITRKIELAEFTLEKSKDIRLLKIKECPIQIEVKVSNINIRDWYAIIELKVLSVYAVGSILDVENYIDSEKQFENL